MTRKLAGLVLVCAAFGLALSSPTSSAQNVNKPLQIGMVKTFFNDLPQAFIDLGGNIFGVALVNITGLQGKLITNEGPFEVAEKINRGDLQLGVFHGHEFAWVQKKYPKLTPLVIAVNKHNDVRSYFIVSKNSEAKTIADLRGKRLDLPMGTKQQCMVYLDRYCTNNAQPNFKDYFGEVSRSSTGKNALDDLGQGRSDVVVIDTLGLEFYKTIKGPAFEKNLRVLQQSESFPPVVIVYKEGNLDQATFSKVRDGLLKAHVNPAADDILTMWQIKSFDPIPNDYSKCLADTLKAYPSREAPKVSLR